MSTRTNRTGDGHPISVVVRRTGLTQDILRAWEKRYQAVVPLRTATGRRLYSEEQVEKLRLLRQLIQGGRRISDVADLDLETLQKLADEDAAEAVVVQAPTARREARGFLAAAIESVDRLDRHGLEQALDAASVALTRPRLRSEVIVPLIEELGRRWQAGTWRIVHEHVASAVLRAFLWSMWRRSGPNEGSASLIVATPAGQRHELGALLVAGAVADLGWRVVYLGCDLPAEEIAAAVTASGSSAILLSLVYPLNDPRLLEEVRRLRHLVGPDLPIIAGGRAAEAIPDELAACGIRRAADLESLGEVVDIV